MATTELDSGFNTWLSSAQPVTPLYSTTQLVVGRSPSDIRRALLRFDLSSIPAGSTIDGALLSLYQQPGFVDAEQQSIHLTTATWLQTEATWNNRWMFMPWSTPGGDFAGSPSAVLQPTQIGGGRITSNVLALVQSAWNAGVHALDILIKVTDEDMLDTIDYQPFGATFPPELTVDYTPPDPPDPSAKRTLALGVGVRL
jgi:hypothetical protein